MYIIYVSECHIYVVGAGVTGGSESPHRGAGIKLRSSGKASQHCYC